MGNAGPLECKSCAGPWEGVVSKGDVVCPMKKVASDTVWGGGVGKCRCVVLPVSDAAISSGL